jgi:hypothetical protein
MHGARGSNPGRVILFLYASPMLLFYIIQRIIFKSFVFSENLTPYIIVCGASGANVDPRLTSFFVLVLSIVEN